MSNIYGETLNQPFGEQQAATENAKNLAKHYVKHFYNEKGEQLAKVEDSEGFREVYDWHGDQKRRRNLGRKLEQVHNNYKSSTQLFQKVYYSKGLILDDERQLRKAYEAESQQYENMVMAAKGALALAFVPSTFMLARRVYPATLLPWAAVYYFGLHQGVVAPALTWHFQSRINSHARPFAHKYGVQIV